ncbi:hypothetical protein ABZP36_013986 [Zizania latifolia]
MAEDDEININLSYRHAGDDGGGSGEEEERGHSESDGDDSVEEEIQSYDEHSESDGDVVEDEETGDDEEEESAGVHGEVAPSTRAAVEGVTVVDADTLECVVCCWPLRPPIFQCEVGHVMCSRCRDKLAAAGRCHVCGVALGGGYWRCHAMEQLVESIRVACPHAAHGCAARPAYYDLDAHQGACPHAPCHCPGVACGFVGSTTALLDHFAAAHNWPCITKVVSSGQKFCVLLQDGFNFILADHSRGGDATASHLLIIMLNMTQQPLGHVISVLGIHPHAAAKQSSSPKMQCELKFFSFLGSNGSHHQMSKFLVECSDRVDGLPDPKQCFQFIVPSCVVREGGGGGGIRIDARITIIG